MNSKDFPMRVKEVFVDGTKGGVKFTVSATDLCWNQKVRLTVALELPSGDHVWIDEVGAWKDGICPLSYHAGFTDSGGWFEIEE